MILLPFIYTTLGKMGALFRRVVAFIKQGQWRKKIEKKNL
jgi:hypothetical protein